MKTHKHLYPQITAFGNLYSAFKGAARGKRSHSDVARFEYDLEENLTRFARAAILFGQAAAHLFTA